MSYIFMVNELLISSKDNSQRHRLTTICFSIFP